MGWDLLVSRACSQAAEFLCASAGGLFLVSLAAGVEGLSHCFWKGWGQFSSLHLDWVLSCPLHRQTRLRREGHHTFFRQDF